MMRFILGSFKPDNPLLQLQQIEKQNMLIVKATDVRMSREQTLPHDLLRA